MWRLARGRASQNDEIEIKMVPALVTINNQLACMPRWTASPGAARRAAGERFVRFADTYVFFWWFAGYAQWTRWVWVSPVSVSRAAAASRRSRVADAESTGTGGRVVRHGDRRGTEKKNNVARQKKTKRLQCSGSTSSGRTPASDRYNGAAYRPIPHASSLWGNIAVPSGAKLLTVTWGPGGTRADIYCRSSTSPLSTP